MVLAKPIITMPATHISNPMRVYQSLLNLAIGWSLLLSNIALITNK